MDSTASARNSSSVEVGISRVYAAISTNQLKFFGDLAGILDELESYSRVTNEKGEVSDEIEDKSTWHSCDALRYIIGHLRRPMNTKFEMHSGGGIKYPKGVFDSHADPSLKSDNKALERRRQARGRTASFDDVNW